jgi:cytochrome c
MAKRIILTAVLLVFVLSFAFAFANQQTGVEKGKALFIDPSFAGGIKSCNKCHPNGRGLKEAGTKTKFNIMGEEQNSLEEAINVCIVNANKGSAIEVDSSEMQDMVSYIKSLGQK